MGKPTGFLDYPRQEARHRDARTRIRDYAPIDAPLPATARKRQAGRCMDCGVPFCQAGIVLSGARLGCPLHNLIPEWNESLWQGDYPTAVQRLLKTNCFPEFTSRVCPALCERACTCGMIGSSVAVRDNERAIIDFAFENDLMQPQPPACRSDKRIAVVGSGPAGLAAAYYLNRRGHTVTVFERDTLPGGLLTYGIAPMKLPQDVVARRVRLMQQEGVEFVTNCAITPDAAAKQLDGYDLVILACGAQKPRPLTWPDMPKTGILYALSFLKPANLAAMDGSESSQSARGKNVIIIGAGDSASDCLAMALRQGCRSVRQLVRRPAADYPQKPDYAHEEALAAFGADVRQFSTQVTALEADDTGALRAVVTSGGETLPCELLILASGFSGCDDTAAALQAALPNTPTLTAGDMANGASLVVLAIASGKQAAAEADCQLMGYTNIL